MFAARRVDSVKGKYRNWRGLFRSGFTLSWYMFERCSRAAVDQLQIEWTNPARGTRVTIVMIQYIHIWECT
jgi:hypothetical protein